MRPIDGDAAIDAIKEYIVDPNWAISEYEGNEYILISEQAISRYEDNVFNYNAGLKSAIQAIVDLPSTQPEIIRCKDCKHWKDSDGVYRRGIGAESKCPVNIRAVYEGNFYCADAKRKEGDVDELPDRQPGCD